jgi:hypothetical protein
MVIFICLQAVALDQLLRLQYLTILVICGDFQENVLLEVIFLSPKIACHVVLERFQEYPMLYNVPTAVKESLQTLLEILLVSIALLLVLTMKVRVCHLVQSVQVEGIHYHLVAMTVLLEDIQSMQFVSSA